MSLHPENGAYGEKQIDHDGHGQERRASAQYANNDLNIMGGVKPLHRNLKGRHMQMIAMYVAFSVV